MTRPYAEVIGDPIAQSKSPVIHNFWLEKLGIDAEYRRCQVRPDELTDYFVQRRGDAAWRGCNVTMPHKLAVMDLVSDLSPLARRVGAANVVIPQDLGLAAGNTDATGFAEPLAGRRFDHAIVVGAGGAARAVLAALAGRATWITILNRDADKAQALLDELVPAGAATALDGTIDQPADLLVNASSLGMAGQPDLPDLERHVMPDGLVYDLVYAPLETPLLKAARARGLATIDGLEMLIGQAGEAFERFFGAPAPRQYDAELRVLLTPDRGPRQAL
ncbi:shikimate dehydrogenase [Sphingomonas sp. SUN039]|uniref:shikimate dehydrogenase family protein n=1 Tax=Sphingomonas sp. SUN039 TaxID=2937787 RepID=UPI002164AC9D|nr:shikimate dehydrogenase [Sphingomonas sp. SUN039]UVO55234.1 shikimate dehydrogenase [Sphingomonas sp. SUN039]